MSRELNTTIEIDAPVNTVWKAIIGFGQYPQWNPFIRSIKGKAKLGEQLEVFALI